MDLAAISVVRFLVSLSRCEVKRARDLLIEQNIPHRFENIRVETERKLTDVTCARVRIENLLQLVGLITGRLNDSAFSKIEANAVKSDTLVDCRSAKGDVAFHGVFHGRSKNFSVRDVPSSSADDRWNTFEAE